VLGGGAASGRQIRGGSLAEMPKVAKTAPPSPSTPSSTPPPTRPASSFPRSPDEEGVSPSLIIRLTIIFNDLVIS